MTFILIDDLGSLKVSLRVEAPINRTDIFFITVCSRQCPQDFNIYASSSSSCVISHCHYPSPTNLYVCMLIFKKMFHSHCVALYSRERNVLHAWCLCSKLLSSVSVFGCICPLYCVFLGIPVSSLLDWHVIRQKWTNSSWFFALVIDEWIEFLICNYRLKIDMHVRLYCTRATLRRYLKYNFVLHFTWCLMSVLW